MKQGRIYFIGPMGGGKMPTNGASLKNWHLSNRLRELPIGLSRIDTEHWKKNPMILVKVLISLLFHPSGRFLISLNTPSVYRLIKAINLMPGKRHLFYWVIGGTLGQRMRQGIVNPKVYRSVELFVVEGNEMKQDLMACGYDNVIVVPNFKKIDYIPPTTRRKQGEKARFVFLSRITEQKGCTYIIQAAEKLNALFEDKYEIDFYGPIDNGYTCFSSLISGLQDVNYKGFLDLRDTKNYDVLASYDAMLFPTFWPGEGFPGVVIDAYISGVPVIATDWHFNKDIIIEGQTGFIIPPHDVDALVRSMEKVIQHPELLERMADLCQEKVKDYNVNNVITMEFLKKNGIV